MSSAATRTWRGSWPRSARRSSGSRSTPSGAIQDIPTSSWLGKKIGIDLGTSTVLIYVKGEGIVVNEPSIVAVNPDGTRILAVGKDAREMVGLSPDTIQVVRPMREGVIADFVVTEGMLHHFIGRVQGRQRLFKPEIMICVPSGVTSVERRGGRG